MAVDEQSLSKLDPRWIAPVYKRTTGLDFLGLRSVQARITGYLLPGIITITPRARYYAFYSWVLVDYEHSHPQGMSLAAFIKHREQIFVLANLAWSASGDDNPSELGLQGSDKLSKHWLSHQEAHNVPLGIDDYLKNKYGGYGPYSGVMRALGLTRQEESGVLGIPPKGQELAQAFAQAIRNTRYYAQRATFDTAESVSQDVLKEYGTHCHLSGLAKSPDNLPTLETLFALDTDGMLPPPGISDSSTGNMKGTLGLILDMLSQVQRPFGEDDFRQAVAYGLCIDYDPYQPARPLRPFLAHWRVFQLREYYVYAIYALWTYFLHWLRLEGPQTFEQFCDHLNEAIDLTIPAMAIELAIPTKSADEWMLREWFESLLDASPVSDGDWETRCLAFAQKSRSPLNEHNLYSLLDRAQTNNCAMYVGLAWMLLSTVYLRLLGLRESDQWNAWHWAKDGGARRRSIDLYVQDVSAHIEAGDSILEAWSWLYRDYILAQHTISALEKWRQRKANTFHFNYDQGVFEWVRDGETGFSASRFRQAYDMLADLGLYEIALEAGGHPQLTELGRTTLQRVLEACGG